MSRTAHEHINWVTSISNDECELVVRRRGVIFYLRYLPDEMKASLTLLKTYIEKLKVLKTSGDNDEMQEAVEFMKSPFVKYVDELSSDISVSAGPSSLHDYLHPKWYLLHAIAEDGETFEAYRVDQEALPYMLSGEHARRKTQQESETWGPEWVEPSDVQLDLCAEEDLLIFGPSKVFIRGEVYFFKAFGGFGLQATKRELKELRRIGEATAQNKLPQDTRIGRLHGVAHLGGMLIGLLLTYIEGKKRICPNTLHNVVWNSPDSLRKKWSEDIGDVVHKLHGAGCVWGDAKPENVLIDVDDEAWVIDFGGGFTPGWVSREKQLSKGGDLEGLAKIQEWLVDPTIQFLPDFYGPGPMNHSLSCTVYSNQIDHPYFRNLRLS